MLDTLLMYLQYPFVQYALVVGILIALCSALLGTTLVLRRMSFIGEGLSKVAFCASAVGGILKLSTNLPLVVIITIVVAIVIIGNNARASGDSVIAMISAAAMGLGYLLVNKFSSSANVSGDVCGILFGSTSILTLSKTDVFICIGMSVITIIGFIVMYEKIFAITFDYDFSKVIGINVKLYNTVLSSLMAIIIVLAMNLVGSLLITALIVFPVMSATQIFRSFKSVTICAAVTGTLTALIGILLSIIISTPVGSTIVLVEAVVFIVFLIIRKVGINR